MTECSWIPKVEAWFDGESPELEEVKCHIAACPECAALARRLQAVRGGVEAVATRETIADAQVPAFIEGIRQGIAPPARGHRGLWALASAATACVLVIFSVFTVLRGGPGDTLSTEVESYSTELKGATVSVQLSDDGAATVWVSMPEEVLL